MCRTYHPTADLPCGTKSRLSQVLPNPLPARHRAAVGVGNLLEGLDGFQDVSEIGDEVRLARIEVDLADCRILGITLENLHHK